MKTLNDFGKSEIPFTQVANIVLKDPNLSLKAKGLYSYLYSKPNNWSFSYKRIILEMQDGKNSVLSAIKELEDYGLLKRIKHSDGRTTYWVTFPPNNFENPSTENQNLVIDNPSTEKAKYRKTQLGKIGTISNKELYNNKDINNNKEIPPSLKEVKAYCDERKNSVDPERFIDFYQSKGWLVGKTRMKDWRACVRNWERSETKGQTKEEAFIPEYAKSYINKK